METPTSASAVDAVTSSMAARVQNSTRIIKTTEGMDASVKSTTQSGVLLRISKSSSGTRSCSLRWRTIVSRGRSRCSSDDQSITRSRKKTTQADRMTTKSISSHSLEAVVSTPRTRTASTLYSSSVSSTELAKEPRLVPIGTGLAARTNCSRYSFAAPPRFKASSKRAVDAGLQSVASATVSWSRIVSRKMRRYKLLLRQ
mmetsp:Transcript_10385/g.39293  ORF Transcript_10385/g.39293 Transcript_10385/m.39293 type:complete len:200 (-) Transcript_10385:1097-1696(-)